MQTISRKHNVFIDFNSHPASDDQKQQQNPACFALETSLGQRILISQGALQEQKVDVIMNSANSQLNHAGGVAAALCKAAGPGLQQESSRVVSVLGSIPVGECWLTRGFNLPCQMVAHAVAPGFQQGSAADRRLFQKSVLTGLAMSASFGAESLAMCGIGTGIFGWPLDLATSLLLQAIHEFFSANPQSSLKTVHIVNHDQKTSAAFIQAAQNYKPPPQAPAQSVVDRLQWAFSFFRVSVQVWSLMFFSVAGDTSSKLGNDAAMAVEE